MRALRAERRPFDTIAEDMWNRLAERNPWATPFSLWAFHRAWWDAYGENAHEQTVVVVDGDAPPGSDPVAIVPLMHRHEVETTDALTRTTIRPGSGLELTPVEPTAKAIFFGASYHADYATVLADPRDLPAVADALVDYLAAAPAADDPHPAEWDVVDLRRLRCGDPSAEALAAAFGGREISEGWTLNLEREDVCPVVTVPAGASFEEYLAGLGKKTRHEIRRKLRRAENAGDDPRPVSSANASSVSRYVRRALVTRIDSSSTTVSRASWTREMSHHMAGWNQKIERTISSPITQPQSRRLTWCSSCATTARCAA